MRPGPLRPRPRLLRRSTVAGPVRVDRDGNVKTTFSEDTLDIELKEALIVCTPEKDCSVHAKVSYDASTKTTKPDPTIRLKKNTRYVIRTTGGSSKGATDLAGNALAEDFVWTFTTGCS